RRSALLKSLPSFWVVRAPKKRDFDVNKRLTARACDSPVHRAARCEPKDAFPCLPGGKVDGCRHCGLTTRPRIVFLLGVSFGRCTQYICARLEIPEGELTTCIRSRRCELDGLIRRWGDHHLRACRAYDSAGNASDDARGRWTTCRLARGCRDSRSCHLCADD